MNLNDLKELQIELDANFSNSIGYFKEHCHEIRLNVDLAFEKVIFELQLKRDKMLRQIDLHETLTTENELHENEIYQLGQFLKTWSEKLKKAEIDHIEVSKQNELALELKKKFNSIKSQLTTFDFSKRNITYKNSGENIGLGEIRFGSEDFRDDDGFIRS